MLPRRVPAVLLLIAVVGMQTAAAAQLQPRDISGLSDSFASRPTIGMPDSVDGFSLAGFTVEAGEPPASCAPEPLTQTAWFRIYHPGGTLNIDTAFGTGSAFDPVVQLFSSSSAVVSNLVELACDNDSGGGQGSDDARLIVPGLVSGIYTVRVGCRAACGGTFDLALSVSYIPGEPAPANDHEANAKQFKIGKTVKTKNVEHATMSQFENDQLTCEIYNTVWYRFTVPWTGFYSFDTFGSNVISGVFAEHDFTRLAVYESSFEHHFANFIEHGCSDELSYGTLPDRQLTGGDEIYVRVGTRYNFNLLDGSYYRLNISMVWMSSMLENGSFESGALAPWTLTPGDAPNGVTDEQSNLSDYSVRMAGAAGKKSVLKQTWTPLGGTFRLPKDAIASATLVATSEGLNKNVKVTLMAVYSDGTPPDKASLTLPQVHTLGQWLQYVIWLPVTRPKATKLVLKIKNKSPAGAVYIDQVELRVSARPTRAADALPLPLPLPPAPPGLRGLT